MPDFPIIDAHVHLYDLGRLRYPWLDGVPTLNRSHDLADFTAATAGVAVERLVFVEVAVDSGRHVEEAGFVQAIANADTRVAGMVAHAPVEKGDAVAADLEALAACPALRGIRRLIQGEPDPSMCLAPNFIAGVRQVGRHGLTFDLCLKHWAMVYALELVRRCPDVTFVLDHIGKPDIRHGLREPWESQLRALAAEPNVVCKLSGVITEADHAAWTPDQVKPYVAHAIECFGFDRVMYGSDWPVSSLTHPYAAWVALLDDIVAGATEAEQRKLFRDTATKVYRLDN